MRFSTRFFRNIVLQNLRLTLKGGDGANGNPKFHSKGGNGGSIIFVGNSKSKLEDLIKEFPSRQITAASGECPQRSSKLGQSGIDFTIKVPTGIDVTLGSDHIIGSVVNQNDRFVVCRGGIGGGPLNAYMAQPGDNIEACISLRVVADIGLLGFSGSWRTDLLPLLTGVQPSVEQNSPASIVYDDGRMISVLELPDIKVDGVDNRLSKLLRGTKAVLLVVDVRGLRQPSGPYLPPTESLMLLKRRLEQHQQEKRPAICVLTEVDDDTAAAVADLVAEAGGSGLAAVVAVSLRDGRGVQELRVAVRTMLDTEALSRANAARSGTDIDSLFTETIASVV